MKDFYTNLRQMDKFDALQKAQITMLESGKYYHPYYWAAFQMIGDYY
jgi:CHAT domain-containing protein